MNNCPLCHSAKNELIFNNSRGNKYLENYVCDNCGFVYTYPRISNEEIQKLYLEGAFSKEARKSAIPDLNKFKQTEAWALERLHAIEEKLPLFFSSPKKVLEIGCGTGSFLWLMQSRGHIVKGIEPDSVFVEVAKKRYQINVTTVLFDDFKSEEKYDLICNFHVIEHILDPRIFIKRMKEHLSNDGYIYIECPTIDNIYTGDLNTFFWDVHVNTFSNKTLPWLIESEGFFVHDVFMNRGFVSVIASKGQGHSYTSDDKNRIIEIIKNHQKRSEKTQTHKLDFLKKVKNRIKNMLNII